MFKKISLCMSLLVVTAVQAEESLLTQACQISQDTAQTKKLVILDTAKASEATAVIVTIVRNEAVSDEVWGKALEFGKTVYGTPKMQDDTTVKFIVERGIMSVDTWFNVLSQVEAIFVAVRSTVEGYTENNARVTIELQ